MKRVQAFPWENAMQFGLGVLRLPPDQFWAMTPRELEAAYRANIARAAFAAPMDRGSLEGMMKRFPDGKPSMNLSAEASAKSPGEPSSD